MKGTRSRFSSSLRFGMGLAFAAGVMIGQTGFAAAQDMDDQSEAPQVTVTEPTPLITVRPGPAVPPGGPPPSTGERPPLPDVYSQPIGPFTMYMDVIATGPSQYGLFTSPGCILDGVFKRGMKLVWRFEVYDVQNAMRVTDRDGSKVSITLPDGTTVPARFEARGEPGNTPPDAPWTWVAVWNIAPDYPLGPVNYSVNVTTPDGRSGTLTPATWGSDYPMVVD